MARWMKQWFALMVGAGVCMASFADVNDSAVKVKWGYIGNQSPAFWGQLDPAFSLCSTGKSQSPINITKKTVKAISALTIHYNPSVMHIVEDGTTDLLIGKTHTLVLDGHGVQLNFSEKDKDESIIFEGKTYHLTQFHLHTPSETELLGQAYPMEIHFVHQNDEGEVAVVAVLVKGGQENASLKQIINHLPKTVGKEETISGEELNPANLIPNNQTNYYHFMGSLTTPPCTEGLHWIVMANAITAAPAQIATLRKAMGGMNARSVQPLNGRVVSYNHGK